MLLFLLTSLAPHANYTPLDLVRVTNQGSLPLRNTQRTNLVDTSYRLSSEHADSAKVQGPCLPVAICAQPPRLHHIHRPLHHHYCGTWMENVQNQTLVLHAILYRWYM